MAKWQIANAVPTSTGLGHSIIPLFSFICMSFAAPSSCIFGLLSLTRHAPSLSFARSFSSAFPALPWVFHAFSCFSWRFCWGHVCLPGCQLLMAVMCIINMHCTAPPAALYFPSVFLPLANWVTQIACEVGGKDSVIKKFQIFWNFCVLLQCLMGF